MSRARPGNGALSAVSAPYLLLAGGFAADEQAVAGVSAQLDTLESALSPWMADQAYLNMTETQADPSRFWSPSAYDRLRRVKADVDPANLIRSNHPVPPADLSSGGPTARGDV